MSNSNDPRLLTQALSAWARADGRGVRSSGAGPGLFSSIQFHWRPDPRGPESYVGLEAALENGRPAIRATISSPSTAISRPKASVAGLGRRTNTNDPKHLGREPDAVCEGCGALGTIGRASRTSAMGEPIEVHRFCRECWPEQSARYRARWTEQDRLSSERFFRGLEPAGAGLGMSFEAATWHTVLDLVREIEHAMRAPTPQSPHELEEFAEEIRRRAPDLDGDMPFEVEAFLQRYGSSLA